MKPVVVYFGHVPAEGAGSAIIVYRHLRRLAAEGWDIRIVADWGQQPLHATCRAHGWPVLELSHRRPWWPPFDADQPWSRAVRAWLWAGEVRAWLGAARPVAAVTYLSAFSDTLSIAAAGFAQRCGVPLSTLIHDDTRCFAPTPADGERAHARRQWVLGRSHRAWFASPELAACFTLDPRRAGILPPIPEGANAAPDLPPGAGTPVRLVYAGNYWAAQIPAFATLAAAIHAGGGSFETVLKEDATHVAALRAAGVDWRAPFARNTEALDYFRSHATALVVSYAQSSDAMPWTRTSFPSKLIEYCHLGRPIAIVAPADTAVAQWARARGYPDYFEPHDTAGLTRFTQKLADADFRSARGALVRSFAAGEFSPIAIQGRFATELRRQAQP
ncbi:MAG: hypothetical protein WCQ89_14400 [Verrucomicrobiota bacterium]|jgi:hypothetical protein